MESQSEPVQPQTTSAEPIDLSDLQPTDARDVPQPEQPSAAEQYEAVAEESAMRAAETATPGGLDEAVRSGLATGDSAANPPTGTGTQLYIGNLFFDVTEDDLRREFAKHGTVSNVRLIYDGRGLSKGYVVASTVELSQ